MRGLHGVMLFLAVVGAAGTAATFYTLSADTNGPDRQQSSTCTLPKETPLIDAPAGQELDVVAGDGTSSTHSDALWIQYRTSATAVVEQAAAHRGVFALSKFTASNALQILFAVSFDPHTGDETLDQAAVNLAKCQAKLAIDKYFDKPSGPRRRASTGSDQVGAIAGVVDLARPFVRAGKPVNFRLLTDGYISPSPTGPNANLLDLQALLDRGMTPHAIFNKYRAQLVVTNAKGIGIEMRGIDRRGNPRASNTVRAEKVVQFWSDYVLPALHAHPINVVTTLP